MTAIGAHWDRDGRPEARTMVQRMLEPLTMYGRDRCHVWEATNIAMGICQRYILPEDYFDEQPQQYSNVVVVADVRLDNRESLYRQIGMDLKRCAQWSDSLVLQAAWQRWGAECVHRLQGDFAFVVWDVAEQTLYCVRDPIGMRPLCYATAGHAFAVASMPKGLLALPGVSHDLDEIRLGEHLAILPRFDGRTFHRQISRVPPGHILRVTRDGVMLQSYWRAPRHADVRFRHDAQYVEHFSDIYAEAVRVRTRSIRPVATTLSAGFDSSSVTALAAQCFGKANQQLTAVTWVPKAGAEVPETPHRLGDERGPAMAVAAMYPNIEHVLVEAPSENPLDATEIFDVAADEPFVTPLVAPMFRATGEQLTARGCGVLLTGQCGNMTISYDGLTLLPDLLRRGRLLRGAREMIALARAPGGTPRRALYSGVAPLMPIGVLRTWHRRRMSEADRAGGEFAYCGVNPAFAEQHRFADVLTRTGWLRQYRPPADGRRARSMIISGIDLGMSLKGAQAVMGVEFRDPTADIRVLEYCLRIPEEQFLRNGRTRWLMRRAMTNVLPPAILEAPHRGLQGSDWPRFVGPYRAAFMDELRRLQTSSAAQRILDIPKIERLLREWPERWTANDMSQYGLSLLRTFGVGRFLLSHAMRAHAPHSYRTPHPSCLVLQ